MNFEDFDFSSSNQCSTQVDPTTLYPVESFLNKPVVPFAVIPLNLTENDFQDLGKLHVEDTCPFPEGRCDVFPTNAEFKPQSYYQDSTYRDNLKHYFNNYQSLESEPELKERVVDLVVKVTNKAAAILPGTFIRPVLFTYAAESGMGNGPEYWHQDNFVDNSSGKSECDKRSYAFLTTLKGDHTLYCTGSYDYNIEQCVPDHTATSMFSPSFGFGTMHRVGKLYGGYHSPPNVNEQRFVLAISIRYPECIRTR